MIISKVAASNEFNKTCIVQDKNNFIKRNINLPKGYQILKNIVCSIILIYFSIYLLHLFIESNETKTTTIVCNIFIIAILLVIMY
jgi:hypothetical protein